MHGLLEGNKIFYPQCAKQGGAAICNKPRCSALPDTDLVVVCSGCRACGAIMATLEDLNVFNLIRRRINGGKTHRSIAEELRRLFPSARGVSSRSVRRFCSRHNLHATSRLPSQSLDILVAYGIGMVRDQLQLFLGGKWSVTLFNHNRLALLMGEK